VSELRAEDRLCIVSDDDTDLNEPRILCICGGNQEPHGFGVDRHLAQRCGDAKIFGSFGIRVVDGT
jgi:hypothetical protein